MTATAEIAVQQVEDAALRPNAALRVVMPEPQGPGRSLRRPADGAPRPVRVTVAAGGAPPLIALHGVPRIDAPGPAALRMLDPADLAGESGAFLAVMAPSGSGTSPAGGRCCGAAFRASPRCRAARRWRMSSRP